MAEAGHALGRLGMFGATVAFFVGSSLLVHYGLFNLATAFWQSRGLEARPLFRNPLPSQSLGEFRGQRWNLAFRDMTAAAVYRPARGGFGRPWALFLSFGLSGLFHEAVISLPVGAGFGLPMGYFLLHGGLVGMERRLASRGIRVGGIGGRLWTWVWILLPLPILFHRPFLEGVVWPLLGIHP